MVECHPPRSAFISVGSNIGPEFNIPRGLDLLSSEVTLDAISTFFRTVPIGTPGGPAFLNGVCAIHTQAAPRTLKYRILRTIERRLGRKRAGDRYAPRVIDLDILMYEDLLIDEPGLTIPDPDIVDRPFLVEALLELAPDLVVPGIHVRVDALLAKLHERSYAPELEFTTVLRQRLGK